MIPTAAHLKRFKTALAHGTVALLFGLGTGQVMAIDVNISDKPLDTLEGVPANILLTMDDSGSMEWNYLPDSIDNNDNTKRAKSSTFNKIYYNPAITYAPAKDKNGASLGNATLPGITGLIKAAVPETSQPITAPCGTVQVTVHATAQPQQIQE